MPIKYDDDGRIKRPGKKIEFDAAMLANYAHCIQDVKFFAETFYYVVHQITGAQLIKLRDYQEEILDSFQNNRLNILMAARQCGKTTCSAIYLLWFCCFQKDKTVAILANKASTAIAILDEIKFACERLPEYIKPGVIEYNKQTVEFDNGCKIIARATSKDALRGESAALIFLDEFAFLPGTLADEFWASNLPVISTGGKCIVVSTPNGTGNLFYKLWKDSSSPDSDFPFVPLIVNWRRVPGRDEAWEKEMRQMLGNIRFEQEFNCLWPSTLIKLKHKTTGKSQYIALEEIYVKNLNKDSLTITYIQDYYIKTENGWEDFVGLKKSKNKMDCLSLKTEKNKNLIATYDHEVFSNGHLVKMKELKVGDFIDTKDGKEKIKTITYKGKEYVYDVLEVNNKEHSFYANDIKTHNCQFQGSSITLIDAEYIINHLHKREPEWVPDEWSKVWKRPKLGHKYVISCDVGGGVGSDFSIINVFDVTGYEQGHVSEQVAIWRCNTLPPTRMAEYVYNSAKYWNDAYVIIEINPGGYGDDVCAELFNEYEYENLYYDIERGEYGVLSTKSTKPRSCQFFKDDLERGKIMLYDEETIDEIGYFEEVRAGVFKAKDGKNLFDDCVMTCIWFSYFLHSPFFEGEMYEWQQKNIKEENPELWHKLNRVDNNDDPIINEADPEMEDAFESFLRADADENDPDNWLLDSEVSRYQAYNDY